MMPMRPFLSALIVAGALSVAPGVRAEDPAAAPEPRPAAEFAVADYAGQVVVVDFWASWCAPCRQALPWLNAMQAKYGEQGLQIVMINLDREAKAAAAMEGKIAPGIARFRDPQGELAEVWELQGMPSTYVYDRAGKQVASHVGFLKSDAEGREAELAALLAKGEK